MLTIVHPQDFFALLVLIPIVLFCLRGYVRRQNVLRAYRQSNKGLVRDTVIKLCLLTAALFFLAAALAQPIWKENVEKQGMQGRYIFLVDTSTSMEARKTPSSLSSLDEAKNIIGDTLKEFPDSCAAIFLFSKLVFPVSSLTCDRDVLEGIINKEIRVDRIPYKGTDIANALLALGERLDNPSSIYHDAARVIVITDGGDTELTPQQVQEINASLFSRMGITFVGVGDPLGAPIPVFNERGAFTGEYMQSEKSIYYARLEEAILKNMAAQLHGRYFTQRQEGELFDALRQESLERKTAVVHSTDLRFLCFGIFTALFFVLLWRRDM